MDDLYKKVGQALRDNRQRLGHSQAEMGEAIGVSTLSMHDYECARTKIPIHNLVKFCAFLGIEPHEVLYDLPAAKPKVPIPIRQKRLVRDMRAINELVHAISERHNENAKDIADLREYLRIAMKSKIVRETPEL